MNNIKNSNDNISSNKTNKKNVTAERIRTGGKNEASKNTNTRNSRSKNSRKNLNNNANPKNPGTKCLKQEPQVFETSKSINSSGSKCVRSKMVDSSTQTSTTLKLHLDGMFQDMTDGYERPSLSSVESEYTEDEEGDEMTSNFAVPSSPLSPRRSREGMSFNNKEFSCAYNFNFDWPEQSRRQHILLPAKLKPTCLQDLENSHERKLLKLADQLDALVTIVPDVRY